jgi:hypothetical protein
VLAYPSHKQLPKLDFPKFNGDNPKIWAKKCEVYFDVFSVPESLRCRYATLNFADRAALWLETIVVSVELRIGPPCVTCFLSVGIGINITLSCIRS